MIHRHVINRRFLSVALNAAICAGSAALVGCNQQPASPQASAPAGAATAPVIASSVAQAPAYTPPSADQLYQLVAPIALFPDKLVAQVLAGATYPDQVSAADTFLEQNQSLQGGALQNAVDPQAWDPSIKGLTVFPKVLDQMAQNIPWTTALGNAYANDPTDVLNAIQVMRQRAAKHGSLQSSAQLRVVDQPATPVNTGYASAPPDDTYYQPAYDGPGVVPAPEQTIEILPADQDTVYVPEYDPQTVYGEEIETYPSYRYEQPGYSTGDIVATGALAFGAGIVVASLFHDNHHHDRPDYGWNSWNMQWRGGGDRNRGHWQRPAVVHGNRVYVSRSTTINRTVNNIQVSGNRNNIGAPGHLPPNVGANRPPALPAAANAPGRQPAGPPHRPAPAQQPMNRPNFNGALTKGEPARFAHLGSPPGVHPGSAPAPTPADHPSSQAVHQAHVNMPGVSAPGAARAHMPHADVPGQPRPPAEHAGPVRAPAQHADVAAPSRPAAAIPAHAPIHAPAGHPQPHVAPMQHPAAAPRPQPPAMHHEVPRAAPVQHAPVQHAPAPMPARHEAPRPAPVQQHATPRPQPQAHEHPPAQKNAGHPPKKDDKKH